jgi:hypothetical protein
VPLEHSSAPRVDFALEHDAHSGSFEPEVEPSDPGEEASDGEHVNARRRSCRPFLTGGQAQRPLRRSVDKAGRAEVHAARLPDFLVRGSGVNLDGGQCLAVTTRLNRKSRSLGLIHVSHFPISRIRMVRSRSCELVKDKSYQDASAIWAGAYWRIKRTAAARVKASGGSRRAVMRSATF